MQRYAMVIDLVPEKIADYKALHAQVWPEVIAVLKQYHIKNYSIFLKDHTLFGYLEYDGNDFDSDMKQVANVPIIQRWWKETEPCQLPWANRKSDEWWAMMDEVFHID